ncbi:MAG: PL29 family lyase N-terminal domain-containing protein [Rikenellaceae bacterium]
MKKLFQTTIAAALSIAMIGASCSSIDELRSDLDDLTARVESLESEVSTINENMTSLNALLTDNVAIKSVEISEDKITFVLSNGGEYTVYKYVTETYNVPSVSVDSDGYWIVSYDNFETYENILDSENNKIYAGGSDGQTPTFSIDSDNYWMVAYGDGAAEYLLDASGNKVSALGVDGETGADGDAFFQDAVATDDWLTLTLSDGTVVEVPISSFSFEIIVGAEGTQYFTYESTQTFDVVQVDVASASISAPYGWSVELTETLLTVTAPVDTRATASTETDIAITAVSASGLVTIAKIEVAVVEALPAPTITTVTAGSPTSTTIPFSISGVSETTEWYYLALKSTESAPAAATVAAAGTKVDNVETLTATATGLSDNTEYIIYVAPYSGSVAGTIVASSAVSTLEITDPYSVTGYTVTGCTGVAGATTDYYYDQYTENVVMLDGTDGNNTISANGIYFLTSANPETEYTLSAGPYQRLVIIGDNREFKSKVNVETFINFGGDTTSNEGIIMYNVDIEQASEPSLSAMFAVNYTDSIYNNFIIENSTITPYTGITAIANFVRSGSGIRNFSLRNNIIYFPTSSAETTVSISSSDKNADLSNLQSYVVENNVIYCGENNTKMFLIEVNDQITNDVEISITNNSIVNGFGNNSFFEVATFKSLEFTKNIVSVMSGGSTTVCNIIRVKNANSDQATDWSAWSVSISIDDIINVSDNKFYAGGGTFTWRISHGSADLVPDPNTVFSNESVDPYDGGTYETSSFTFIPATTYTGYGASDLW